MMNKNPLICAIVAVGPFDVIGHNGSMPWHSKKDFYHFKTTTTPYPCIFGKNTYLNMPKTPLPNRLNIVCSSGFKDEYINGVFYATSVESAINFAKSFNRYDKIFICGGSIIYKYALDNDLIDVLYLTKIKDNILKEQIKTQPDKFTYFPTGTKSFDTANWEKRKIIYPDNLLPTEPTNIKTEFWKYVRIR